MNVVRTTYERDQLAAEKFDCLWVFVAERTKPGPLKGSLLQWIDWKMRGILSQFILQDKSTKSTTFIPTMRRFPVPFLAIEREKMDWEAFRNNCEGLRLKKLLFVCETENILGRLETEAKKHAFQLFPEEIKLTCESPG